jgi:hypothetical protein
MLPGSARPDSSEHGTETTDDIEVTDKDIPCPILEILPQ